MISAQPQSSSTTVPTDAAQNVLSTDVSSAGTRRSPPAVFQLRGGRAFGVVACVGAAVWAAVFEHLTDPARTSLVVLLTALSLLAAFLPASGPRGQRVGLLPALGLAVLLLLPPLAALLPLLLANTAYAFSQDMPQARRSAFERGVWLAAALAVGGILHSVLHGPRPWDAAHTPLELALIPLGYGGVYAAGRLLGLRPRLRAGQTARRHAWATWCLEAVTLAVTTPAAVLMALAYPALGPAGVGGAAALLALMLVVAHFGFETALLREQVRAMEKISAVSVSQTSAPKVLERFLHLSGRLVSSDRAALWLTDDSHTRLDRLTASPDRSDTPLGDAASIRFGEGLVGRVAQRKTPLIVRDGALDPRLTPEEGRRAAASFSLMLLPLMAGGEVLGVVQFERDALGAFTVRELGRVRALASQTAATLDNVRSHQDVHNQAVTDGLTGLFNRRHIQAVLLDERRRAQRYGHALSVIMLDVDGFKTYNDTYGHVQGDVLLKMLAQILRQSVRAVDVVGRYGGEEFIVVLPETPGDEAYQTAERLRQAVAQTVFPGFAADPGLVVFKTISLGVATYPETTNDTQALVTLADSALYRAKRGGRNQTVVAEGEE